MCLQIGWYKSPLLFCTVMETARDVAQDKLEQQEPLEPHPLEMLCLPETNSLPLPDCINSEASRTLLDVYMDDFIGLAEAITEQELIHFTQAVLHGIRGVFPPPGPMDDLNNEPISIKKLKQGDDHWDTQKEILNWFFDGVTKCYQSRKLPNSKSPQNQRIGKIEWQTHACNYWHTKWAWFVVATHFIGFKQKEHCATTRRKQFR